ncbi:tyrosine-type recombinase/integrase [Tropicimonas aquimaris]|uniref:Tyrosine-type recombinase/integrase n=1 Tax=Tropicimonas aquimaris TaxID=914152 RepID=A0ABW3IVL9_9RHOB
MPQHAKGPRLYRRKDTGIYIIRDTGRGDQSTGTRDCREAETALARYLAERDRPRGPATPDQMTVSEVLVIYGTERAPKVKDPQRIAYAIQALVPFWGELPVSAIRDATVGHYTTARNRAPGTIRKELGVLKAALRYCADKGYLVNPPTVELPEKPEAKDRWLTRSEFARLLWAAWRNPKAKHLARFMLVAAYTGSRKSVILNLRFMPNTYGGWVDTDRGILHRRGEGQAETKKRTPKAPIPRQLLAHLRRWERNGARYVVEIEGNRVGSIKTAWKTATDAADFNDVTPHTLRHTAITWAMQHGAKPADVCSYFGLSLETLQRVYWHHHPDFQESVLRAMEAKL